MPTSSATTETTMKRRAAREWRPIGVELTGSEARPSGGARHCIHRVRPEPSTDLRLVRAIQINSVNVQEYRKRRVTCGFALKSSTGAASPRYLPDRGSTPGRASWDSGSALRASERGALQPRQQLGSFAVRVNRSISFLLAHQRLDVLAGDHGDLLPHAGLGKVLAEAPNGRRVGVECPWRLILRCEVPSEPGQHIEQRRACGRLPAVRLSAVIRVIVASCGLVSHWSAKLPGGNAKAQVTHWPVG